MPTMDFPTWTKNAQVPTQEVDITPPAFNSDASNPAARMVEQQWRDADAAGLGKRHPLSINRDAGGGEGGTLIANDPYSS